MLSSAKDPVPHTRLTIGISLLFLNLQLYSRSAIDMSTSTIVDKLRDQLAQSPDFRADFETAFQKALSSGVPQFAEWGIATLDDYINYYESFLKWVPTEDADGTVVLYHICMFYFVLDLIPMINRQNPILPSSVSPYTWLSQWIIDYAMEMGKFMDSPDSITDKAIDTFYQAPSYHMQDYDRVDWKTFNEFFARKIKPEVRPIDSPSDNTVIVSPADATFDGFWPVDDSNNCYFDAKGIPWSISQLLDDKDFQYGPTFSGGKFCHSFLGPSDYHRQHAPVSGTVVEARVIQGLCYLEVEVVADPTRNGQLRLAMRRTMNASTSGSTKALLDAPDNPGYQFIQARALILIDTPDLGLVAVLPIGMAQVSSVVLSVKAGDVVRKGDEISYFQLGGSDIVMVFQPGANVSFTASVGTHYAFGKELARASPGQAAAATS
ncbi:hypothetical protein BV20DRAFT_625640 [Pilatotrama ljubarskyi]|nr:hypothetical protein BV20DRAFT_625640 [Pilatotrama ljubarskyi]